MTPDSTLAVTKTCPKDGVHLSLQHVVGRYDQPLHIAGLFLNPLCQFDTNIDRAEYILDFIEPEKLGQRRHRFGAGYGHW